MERHELIWGPFRCNGGAAIAGMRQRIAMAQDESRFEGQLVQPKAGLETLSLNAQLC